MQDDIRSFINETALNFFEWAHADCPKPTREMFKCLADYIESGS